MGLVHAMCSNGPLPQVGLFGKFSKHATAEWNAVHCGLIPKMGILWVGCISPKMWSSCEFGLAHGSKPGCAHQSIWSAQGLLQVSLDISSLHHAMTFFDHADIDARNSIFNNVGHNQINITINVVSNLEDSPFRLHNAGAVSPLTPHSETSPWGSVPQLTFHGPFLADMSPI